MKVPYSYYEDEVRDGFYIHGMMKRAWAASVEVLEEIDRICKKYDITYFADAGTLLGAVRHHGFIPWDDDLDVCMCREEYERFLEAAEIEFKDSKWFKLVNIHTEPEYDQLFSRIVSGKQISFNKEYLEKFHGFPFAVGVDVFPLDYISENEKEEELRCELVKIVDSAICRIKELNDTEIEDDDNEYCAVKKKVIDELVKPVEDICKTKIDRDGNIVNQLYLLEERLITLYSKDECKKLALMPVWIKSKGNLFEKEYYQYSTEMEFENVKITVPSMYDAILKEKYGDYMKLVHNWDFHNYPFYGEQIKFLEEKTGIKYPEYEFNIEDLNKNRIYTDAMDKDRYIISQVRNSVKILMEAHGEINNYKNDVNIVLDILAQCQDMAIMLGNMIEEKKGEGFGGIHYIEEYCESVYHEYEKVNQQQNDNTAEYNVNVKLLNTIIHKAEDSIQNMLNVRQSVVFIVNKVNSWKYLEHLWLQESDNHNVDVKVVVIPYYYKNVDLSIREEVFEISDFPKELNVMDYREYDIKKMQPDRIYIQSPFDQYNYTLSVASGFYASNIKHYTDELIYVPDFRTDEIDERDMRAYASMDYFVTMPGVVQADKVIVWSESMKNLYVKKLTEFAGEDTQSIWEDKIYYDERFYNENVEEKEIIIPDEWKKLLFVNEGVKKKSILYYTSTNMIIEKGKEYIDKLRRVLKIFKDNQDVVVIWRAYHEVNSQLGLIAPELSKEYEQIIAEYKREGWGILDDTKDVKYALSVCDGYYGDAGSIIQMCRNKKIPVMVQNVEV